METQTPTHTETSQKTLVKIKYKRALVGLFLLSRLIPGFIHQRLLISARTCACTRVNVRVSFCLSTEGVQSVCSWFTFRESFHASRNENRSISFCFVELIISPVADITKLYSFFLFHEKFLLFPLSCSCRHNTQRHYFCF